MKAPRGELPVINTIAPEKRASVKVPRPLRAPWTGGRPYSRKCGGCNMCCVAPAVDEPDLKLEPGEACKHLVPEGCGIFTDPKRPSICARFACSWLRGDGTLEQRPDRMGALPILQSDGRQTALYLAPGVTPETMSRQALKYVAHWHRAAKTAVLVTWGVRYGKVTAMYPDGTSHTEDTVFGYGGPKTPAPPTDPFNLLIDPKDAKELLKQLPRLP